MLGPYRSSNVLCLINENFSGWLAYVYVYKSIYHITNCEYVYAAINMHLFIYFYFILLNKQIVLNVLYYWPGALCFKTNLVGTVRTWHGTFSDSGFNLSELN